MSEQIDKSAIRDAATVIVLRNRDTNPAVFMTPPMPSCRTKAVLRQMRLPLPLSESFGKKRGRFWASRRAGLMPPKGGAGSPRLGIVQMGWAWTSCFAL